MKSLKFEPLNNVARALETIDNECDSIVSDLVFEGKTELDGDLADERQWCIENGINDWLNDNFLKSTIQNYVTIQTKENLQKVMNEIIEYVKNELKENGLAF